MKIGHLVVGQLQVNCYVVYDEESGRAMVVDPGDDAQRILGIIRKEGLGVDYIVCTHAHFDHIGAVKAVKEATGAKIVIHGGDREIYARAKELADLWGFPFDNQPEPDIFVSEGDELKAGNLLFSVLSTPGHSPGGFCLYGEGLVITGDTIFAGSVGRTDFYGGNVEELKTSFKRILALPEDTKILPGHGDWSTVGREKRENFFVSEL